MSWQPETITVRDGSAVCLVRMRGRGPDGLAVDRRRAVAVSFDEDRVSRIEGNAGEAATIHPPGPGSPSTADLAGVWRLAEWTSAEGDEVRHPAGRDARGVLIYERSGWMSVHISRADGTSGAFSYCGRWEVRADEVVHHVEIDSRPERPGTSVTRRAELRGDELVLLKPPEEGRVDVLRWRRHR